LAVPHQEQKVYVVTSPVISDACVHVSGVDAPAPAELRTYPHCLVLDSEAHDREANDVAPVREAGVGHAAAVAAAAAVVYVVVGCSMVARVVVPQTLKALLRSIQLVALVAAVYAATWSAGDDVVVVAHVEVERAATAVVVLGVQTQG
jgi:hypothetical protein